ncbi:MAG: hypothetical protein ACRCWF_09560 [Beijerinckiaceae bacterium]
MSAALNMSMPNLVASGHSVSLRRTGERPLVFQGVEICSAMSYIPGAPLWYEINVYRTATESFVANVRMFTRSENDKDRFSACEADSFEEAIMWLEAYEPASDIRADLPLDDADVSVVELSIKAAAMRIRLSEARRQYRDLLGEVLFAVEAN